MPKKSSKKEKRIPMLRGHNFQKYYATNVVGGLTNQDFRIELLNEKVEDKEGWYGISDALIIFSPIAAKNLHKILTKAIKLYEQEHGKIETKVDEERVY